jgi:hypothetical protein
VNPRSVPQLFFPGSPSDDHHAIDFLSNPQGKP